MSNLVGNLVPKILNFFHHSVNKKMIWVRYCLGVANLCLRYRRKINSHKMEGFGLMSPLQVTLQRRYLSLLLWNCYFFRNYHNIKYWPEIRKSEILLFWVLSNIWRLRRVRNTKFGASLFYRLTAYRFKIYKLQWEIRVIRTWPKI